MGDKFAYFCTNIHDYPHKSKILEQKRPEKFVISKKSCNFALAKTKCCCFSSVVERILGKDEVPSSTLGSSSEIRTICADFLYTQQAYSCLSFVSTPPRSNSASITSSVQGFILTCAF